MYFYGNLQIVFTLANVGKSLRGNTVTADDAAAWALASWAWGASSEGGEGAVAVSTAGNSRARGAMPVSRTAAVGGALSGTGGSTRDLGGAESRSMAESVGAAAGEASAEGCGTVVDGVERDRKRRRAIESLRGGLV